MDPKAQALFLLLPLLLSSVVAYNVTQILEPFSDFAIFNNYLTQTKLADEINRRQTITVLVVDNSKMSALSSLPAETLKYVMAVHVILDYYDKNKLSHIPYEGALLTTLFQTTGIANNNLGFLNVTSKPNEVMLFGSAIPEASISSTLSKVVIAIPYNISILQISDPIIPPGIEGAKQASSSMAPKHAPALAPVAKGGKSTTNALAPNAVDSPGDAPGSSTDTPIDALKSKAPEPSTDQAASNTPAASPASPRKVAKMSASSSSASRMVVGSIVGLFAGVVLLVAF